MRFKIFVLACFMLAPQSVYALDWMENKSEHFVIRYPSSLSRQWSLDVLRHAERYYDSIAQTIDYPRYKNYWTWDKRVEITVYPDKDVFLRATNQPAWSKGGAIHRPWFTEQRRIVTFYQEENFTGGLLPHEISHLMLIDFIGRKHPIPLWFNEGVAQLHEDGKLEKANQIMRNFAQKNMQLPFEALFSTDIRNETDPLRVAIFYAQSVSVVDFMIRQNGSKGFGVLCRAMRDGEGFHQALQSAYRTNMATADQLEKKWLSYIKN